MFTPEAEDRYNLYESHALALVRAGWKSEAESLAEAARRDAITAHILTAEPVLRIHRNYFCGIISTPGSPREGYAAVLRVTEKLCELDQGRVYIGGFLFNRQFVLRDQVTSMADVLRGMSGAHDNDSFTRWVKTQYCWYNHVPSFDYLRTVKEAL